MGSTGLPGVSPQMLAALQALAKTGSAVTQGLTPTPASIPGGGGPPSGRGQLPQMQPQAQPQGFQGAPIPGGAPPGPQAPQPPPPVSYNTGGTQGQLPPPVARPPLGGGWDPGQSGAIAQSKLGANGAAAFSAVQGVSSVLHQWNQRREQKESAEAANIANNLMTAMQNNDVGTVSEILNDPKSTKILNKVYKGWLQKDQEQQKQKETKQKPPDPLIQGFENGIKAFLGKKQQQQPQSPPAGGGPPGQAPPQGPPGAGVSAQGNPSPQPAPQQGQMPQSIGGYRVPQAGPAQLQARAAANANAQANQADPRRMVTPSPWDQTPKNQADLAKYQSEMIRSQNEITKSVNEIQISQERSKAAQANLKAAMLRVQSAGEKGKSDAQKAQADYMIKQTELDIAKQRLKLQLAKTQQAQNPKADKQLSASNKLKLESLNTASDLIAAVQKRKGGFTESDRDTLSAALKGAGATSLAQSLPTTALGRWWGGEDTVNSIASAIDSYRTSMTTAWGTEGSKENKATKTDNTAGEAPPKAGDVVGGFKFKGGDPNDQKNYEPVKGKEGSAAVSNASSKDEPEEDDDDDEENN